MQFTICENVKEIKDSMKVFIASGDCGKCHNLWTLTVQAFEDSVTFTGVSGTRVTFRAEVVRPGKYAVCAEDLVNAVKSIEGVPSFDFRDDKEHTVNMTEADGFSRNIGSWTDTTVSGEEVKYNREIYLSLDGGAVVEAIKAVKHAASDDESKYAMTGVNFDFSGLVPDDMDGSKIYAIATDGRRLAWSVAGEIPAGVSGIIPKDNISVKGAIASFIAERASKSYPVTFRVSAVVEKTQYREDITRYCSVDFGRFHIVGAEINRDFPEWRRVIPSASVMNSEFTLAPDFVKESDRISKTVNNKYKKIVVTVNGEVVTLDSDIAKQVLKSATNVSGFSMFDRFAINVNYLREAVKAAGKSVVRFQMVDKGRPILATVGDGASGSVIMPMNLDC